MSKYIKLEDAIDTLEYLTDFIQDRNYANGESLLFEKDALAKIKDLPTIEVSVEELRKKYKDFYEQGKIDAILEVSEDCISREWVLNGLSKMADDWVINNAVQHGIYEAHDFVKHAPSVVPTTEQSSKVAEGENISENGFLCSVCRFGDFDGFHGYEPNFCPNCGAKMRGDNVEDD